MRNPTNDDDDDTTVLSLLLLLMYLVPATVYFSWKVCCRVMCRNSDKDDLRKQGNKRSCSQFPLVHFSIFVIVWAIFFTYLGTVKTVEDLSDPYAILNIPEGASKKMIKKAYRKLSLVHHPDKPGGDTKLFREVADAHRTLTDPKAWKNWKMYGHPDGALVYRVKLLPSFLLPSKGGAGSIMVLYVLALVSFPLLVYFCCIRRGAKQEIVKVKVVEYVKNNLFRTGSPSVENIVRVLAGACDMYIMPSAAGCESSDDMEAVDKKLTKRLVEYFRSSKFGKALMEEKSCSTSEILLHLHLRRREPEVKSRFAFGEGEGAKEDDLSMFANEKLIVLLKHVHSALLIMLEISINEQDRESALLLGNLLGLFAQGISPTLSDVAVKKIQTDETGEAFPKISLFLKAEVLDEKEIGVGDLITCTVKVERKEGPKNGASISTYLGETSELRSPGVESIYLKGATVGAVDVDPISLERWLIILSAPEDKIKPIKGYCFVDGPKLCDNSQDVSFQFYAPNKPALVELEVHGINLNFASCHYEARTSVDVVVIDDEADTDFAFAEKEDNDSHVEDLPSDYDETSEDENEVFY